MLDNKIAEVDDLSAQLRATSKTLSSTQRELQRLNGMYSKAQENLEAEANKTNELQDKIDSEVQNLVGNIK